MSLFIIGDVHGCFHTYMKLLNHWEPKTETLIQVGDLVDRGANAPLAVRLAYEVKKTFKNSAHFLKGNHEKMMVRHFQGVDDQELWFFNGGKETISQFENQKLDPKYYMTWLNNLPLFWENKHVMVTHAGISGIGDPFDQENPHGVLWNRAPLANIGKLQVVGHTPRPDGKPEFMEGSNAWNIDTGAFSGACLTGIKLKNNGTFLKSISVPTDPKDMSVIN